ncbi:hypothetical protein C8D92_103107 [Tamilnaduibacter salinus]|uniref:Uncharacterized protein n=1 Tax=Tamilnaduibacter salinus TaxID=1484056 RepID=A0A2U1CY50_9GAMM|nr:hypothetical protein [Tamilnaduibacter salinus]PVY77422.1 hypothetical protein C8D92_103107 [Tamilnaduibacter salinus]
MPDARQKRGIRRTVAVLLLLIVAIVTLVLARQFILPAEAETAAAPFVVPDVAGLSPSPAIGGA